MKIKPEPRLSFPEISLANRAWIDAKLQDCICELQVIPISANSVEMHHAVDCPFFVRVDASL